MGLVPSQATQECYLIPYGKECQFQISYQGLVSLAYRNPNIANISAECVYEGDDFDYSLGLSPKLEHRPANESDKLTFVYAIVRFKDSDPIFKVMSIKEWENIKTSPKQEIGVYGLPPKTPKIGCLKKRF